MNTNYSLGEKVDRSAPTGGHATIQGGRDQYEMLLRARQLQRFPLTKLYGPQWLEICYEWRIKWV